MQRVRPQGPGPAESFPYFSISLFSISFQTRNRTERESAHCAVLYKRCLCATPSSAPSPPCHTVLLNLKHTHTRLLRTRVRVNLQRRERNSKVAPHGTKAANEARFAFGSRLRATSRDIDNIHQTRSTRRTRQDPTSISPQRQVRCHRES